MDSIMKTWTRKAEEGLPTSDFGLQTSDFRLQTSYFKLQTSDLTKFELRISHFWPLRLNASCLDFWPPTSLFLLLTSALASDFRLPTSDFRFPTFDFRLPISNFRLPTSNFPLLGFRLPTWLLCQARSATRSTRSATRVLMLNVKAQ